MAKNNIELNGNSLVFTDLHVGISNDKPSRQKIAEKVIDEIIGRIETEDIKQVFFLGDLFHQRTSIEVTSLNVANDLVRRLASECKVFLLQGNHDLYEKYNSVITSLNIFDLNNVSIISVPTEIGLNGQNVAVLHPAGSVDPSVSQGERAILGAPGPGQGAEGRELLRLHRIVSAPDDQGRKQEQEADQEPSRPLPSQFYAHGLCLPCLRFF